MAAFWPTTPLIVVLTAVEGHVGGATPLIGCRLALGRVILVVMVRRRRLALAAEGTGGVFGIGHPHFEELVNEPALPSGVRLRSGHGPVLVVGEHPVRRHVRLREHGPARRIASLPPRALGYRLPARRLGARLCGVVVVTKVVQEVPARVREDREGVSSFFTTTERHWPRSTDGAVKAAPSPCRVRDTRR